MIAIIGAGGQLGWELARQLGSQALPLTHADCELQDPLALWRVLSTARPAAIINAAAYTKVDLAEKEPDQCWATNATAVGHLADAATRLGIPLVQVSTDYLFDAAQGRATPWKESDPPQCQGTYAQSKLAGEHLAETCPRHLIVRTCGLYGALPTPGRGGNFVKTMLRLGQERGQVRVVGDQRCTPSYVPHVAAGILKLLDRSQVGVFNVVNSGETTWFDFAAEIFRLARLEVRMERITTAEFGAPAPRPAYSVLDDAKFRLATGAALPTWQAALAEFIASGC